jgi:Protein kinase domain
LGLEPLSAGDPRGVAGYRLRSRLGAGGMGQVYLAFTAGGRPVALKVMHPQLAGDDAFRRRFEREAAAARRVHGLYTAEVLEADPAASPPWLVTAYVPGPSLREAVQEYGPMPERTVLTLMAGVSEALQAIHAAGVIHRDLKPSNVLLAPDGPRVIDFGIARAAEDTELTGTGNRVGSVHYMAPEQVAGAQVTAAADVFALGALAVYAATGRAAFGEGPELAVMYRIRHETANLSGCPPEVRSIAGRCLAKTPADRPSPAEVLAWCRNHTAGQTQQITQPWLPPALTGSLPGHMAPRPRPAPVSPPTVVAAPGGPSPSRRPRRHSPTRRLRTGAGIVAAIVACAWLLAHHPGRAPTGVPGSPSVAAQKSWLAGTWVGAADQPTGVVTHWTAELSFPDLGRTGTFRFPTLGCSGKLIVTVTTGTTASVREHVTRNLRKLCAPSGLIKLTRTGASGMDMAWQDSADRGNVATAHLSPAR